MPTCVASCNLAGLINLNVRCIVAGLVTFSKFMSHKVGKHLNIQAIFPLLYHMPFLSHLYRNFKLSFFFKFTVEISKFVFVCILVFRFFGNNFHRIASPISCTGLGALMCSLVQRLLQEVL